MMLGARLVGDNCVGENQAHDRSGLVNTQTLFGQASKTGRNGKQDETCEIVDVESRHHSRSQVVDGLRADLE